MKDINELTKIAKLAKLSLDGEDTGALLADMARYMAVADIVKSADLSGYDCSATREDAPLREDVLAPSYPAEDLLRNAAGKRDGHYVADTGGRRAR